MKPEKCIALTLSLLEAVAQILFFMIGILLFGKWKIMIRRFWHEEKLRRNKFVWWIFLSKSSFCSVNNVKIMLSDVFLFTVRWKFGENVPQVDFFQLEKYITGAFFYCWIAIIFHDYYPFWFRCNYDVSSWSRIAALFQFFPLISLLNRIYVGIMWCGRLKLMCIAFITDIITIIVDCSYFNNRIDR